MPVRQASRRRFKTGKTAQSLSHFLNPHSISRLPYPFHIFFLCNSSSLPLSIPPTYCPLPFPLPLSSFPRHCQHYSFSCYRLTVMENTIAPPSGRHRALWAEYSKHSLPPLLPSKRPQPVIGLPSRKFFLFSARLVTRPTTSAIGLLTTEFAVCWNHCFRIAK